MWSEGSSGLIRVSPGSCQVQSLGSLGCALVFIWGYCGAHWGSSCLSGVAGFIGVPPECRRVHPAFIRVRPGSLRLHLGSLGSWGYVVAAVGFIQVHCGAGWRSSDSSEVARFIWVHTGGRPVHHCSLGSLGCALVVFGLIRGRWVHWGAP